MTTTPSTSTQITDEYAPLDVLALRALRRYGESSPSTVDAETMLMFMDYANSVLDDVMEHPYWKKGVEIPYYNHITERRNIPDNIMLLGLLAKYAADQTSAKAQRYEMEYFKRLNQILFRTRFGVGAQFEMQVVDYGDKTVDDPGVY